jgi:O-antigen/teichoic acid export membrane protein
VSAQPPDTRHTPDILDSSDAGATAIRGSAVRGVGYGVGLLLSAASVPLVVRHLGLEDFGRFVLVSALITLVGGLTEVGLQSVGLREYSTRTGADRDRLMRNLLGVRLALTGVGVLLALGFTLAAGYDRVLVLGTVLAGVALLVQSVQTLLAVPLAAQLRLGWTTAAELLRQTITVGLTIALVLVGARLLPFFAVAIPGALATVALTAVLVRRMTPFRPAFHPGEWWTLLRDTFAFAVATAVNIAYFRIAIVLMSLLATELETGYFAASFRVLEVLLPIPSLVIGAVFPILARAARDDRQRLAYVTQRVLEVALIAGGGMVVLLEVGAPVIIDILAGEAGEPAVEVLRIQAPALLATFLATAGGFSLLSLHRHREILLTNVVALVLSVGLTLALVPGSGARGAAIATTTAEWALAGATVVLLLRAMHELDLALRTAVPVAIGMAVGLAVIAAPVPVLVQAVVAPALYVGVLVALRTIPRELTDAFLTRMGRA